MLYKVLQIDYTTLAFVQQDHNTHLVIADKQVITEDDIVFFHNWTLIDYDLPEEELIWAINQAAIDTDWNLDILDVDFICETESEICLNSAIDVVHLVNENGIFFKNEMDCNVILSDLKSIH